jgi:hypothetical protein
VSEGLTSPVDEAIAALDAIVLAHELAFVSGADCSYLVRMGMEEHNEEQTFCSRWH